jgi:hypothetical protein
MTQTVTSIEHVVQHILRIARKTLVESGAHIPTAVLHTTGGYVPIIMPFKDDQQKRALMERVKEQVLDAQAYAVTTVTCARLVDNRTGEEDELLVLATCVRSARPYVVFQPFHRDRHGRVVSFGNVVTGEDAEIPGQMMIIPDWDAEARH